MSFKNFLWFFLLVFSESSYATMFGYLGDTSLSGVMEGSVSIPPFVKQGDIVTIQAKVKSFTYGARWMLSQKYNTCDSPNEYPKVFEVVEWPREIKSSNAVLTLISPDSGFGISSRTSVRQCHTYIQEDSSWKPAWETTGTGNAYQAKYRVSQITAAKTDNVRISLLVGSGRSELSEGEIVNEIKKYKSAFGSIMLDIPVVVRKWCSANVTDGKDLVLSYGVLAPSDIEGKRRSQSVSLRCEGSDGEFNLSWGNGENVNTTRKIDLKQGVESNLSINGADELGKVKVLADTDKSIIVTSVLKAKAKVMAGAFSGGEVLVIAIP